MTKEEKVKKLFEASMLMTAMLSTEQERLMGVGMLWELANELKLIDNMTYYRDLVCDFNLFKLGALRVGDGRFNNAEKDMPKPSESSFNGNPLDTIASILARLYVSNDHKYAAIIVFCIMDFAASIGVVAREKVFRTIFNLGNNPWTDYVGAKSAILGFLEDVEVQFFR